MKSITLKLAEFVALYDELAGFTTQEGKVIPGILSAKMSLANRYWLNEIFKKCEEEKIRIEEVKNDLIKKLGETSEDGQTVFIPTFIEDQPNPAFAEFQTEFNTLLLEEKELKFKDISFEVLENIETELHCPTFFKLIELPQA